MRLVTICVFGLLPFAGRAAWAGNGREQERALDATSIKKLSLAELMEVEVTSVSKRPEKLSESPSAIQVIQAEEIRRSGAATLPEVLRLAPNLQVAQRNSHDWAISARGFNTELANKLLVLIDGRTVYTPLFSGVFWDLQDYLLEDVERVEVISGPGGTLWGANAVNGVININTKTAQDTQGFFGQAGVGNVMKDRVAARYGGHINPGLAFRVAGKYFDREDERVPSGASAADRWRSGRGGFRVDTVDSPVNAFTVLGDFHRSAEDQTAGGRARTGGANLLGRWSRRVSDRSDFSLQSYFDHSHLSLPKAAAGAVPAGVLIDDLDTYDLDFQHRSQVGGKHRLIWGLGYRFTHDVVQSAPTLVLTPPVLDHHLFSAFLQDEVQLSDRVQLTFGSKVERNGYTGFEIEPSARVRWNASTNNILWSAVSRAVRTPSRIDRDFSQPTGLPAPFPASILNGNPEFTSENVIAYEAGYRAQVTGRVAFSIALFFNRYDQLRSTTPAPAGFPSFGFPLVFENNLEGNTKGSELTLTYQPVAAWRLSLGHTFVKSDLRVAANRVDFSNALNETADPEHQVTVRSSLDVRDKSRLDASLRWVDTLRNNNGPNPGTVPSYFELDMTVAHQITRRFELSISGRNLLHEQHVEYGFPGPARVELRRAAYLLATFR